MAMGVLKLTELGGRAQGLWGLAQGRMWTATYRGARAGIRGARAYPNSTLTGGAVLAGGGLIGTAYSAYKMEQSAARAGEAGQMARLILTAQSGPFGPSGRAMGMGPNTNNTAGLTLAAHYAKNRGKNFGVLGLKFL
jgi:hypothetical protein